MPVLKSSAPVGSSQSKNLGLLGHGARDRDSLLLATGELSRKVIHSLGQADELEGLARVQGGLGDLGDESDVLARR